MKTNFLYIAPFMISVALMAGVAAMAWPRHGARGRRAFILFCFAAGYWSFTEGLLYLGFDIETNFLITCFQYLGIVLTAPTFLILSCIIFGFESWLKPYRARLLYIVPLFTLIAVWTTSYHHLFYADWYTIESGPFPMLGLHHGPLFWVSVGYHYLLLAVAFFLLLHQFLTSSGFKRGQAGVILTSLFIVWVASGIYITGHSPIRNMDLSPIAFSFAALSFAWGFYRYNFLDIMPIAKAEIFDGFDDAILVLDKKNRFVSINPAGERLIKKSFADVSGKKIDEVIDEWPKQSKGYPENSSQELTLNRLNQDLTYELRFSILKDWRGNSIGQLVVFYNITKRKRLEKKLFEMATTDPLTGVCNRRRIFELADAEFKKNKRYGSSLSVIMIDIDNFKQVNDRYGHDVGDTVLKTLIQTCQPNLRTTDHLGRLGGEEFIVLLTETKLSDAEKCAEKLRDIIEATAVPVKENEINITISLGVAAIGAQDESFNDTLKRADKALYRAKSEGRNRVITADK
jgi:diguanylate cyclase (GGDEF)-like protein